VVGFEGSCPQSLEGVKREGPQRFRIFPAHSCGNRRRCRGAQYLPGIQGGQFRHIAAAGRVVD
jgi:hypothetical protein